MPVITGAAEYPQGIIEQIRRAANKVTVVDALSMAETAGNIKVTNVVLLGVLAKNLDIDREVWLKALEQIVPTRFLAMNKKAFQIGLQEAA